MAQKRLVVSSPVKRPNGKTWWVECGTAHKNKDGSLNLYLDVLPINGQLTVRAVDVAERAAAGGRDEDPGVM